MVNPNNPSDYYHKVANYVMDVTGRPYRLGRTSDSESLGQISLALLEAVN